MVPEALRAKPSVTPLFPGRLISAASIARLATEIDPDVPMTEPVVRIARVSTFAASIADVILIAPELLPPTSPILNVPAVTRKISDCLRER